MDPGTVDIDCNGALQQGDGEDEAGIAFEVGDDTFGTAERAVDEADSLAGAEVGPRLGGEAGAGDRLESGDFVVLDGDERLTHGDDEDDAGDGEDGKAAVDVEVAEDVAGEEGEVGFDEDSGGGAPGAAVARNKRRIAFSGESGSDGLFVMRLYTNGVPGIGGGFLRCFRAGIG